MELPGGLTPAPVSTVIRACPQLESLKISMVGEEFEHGNRPRARSSDVRSVFGAIAGQRALQQLCLHLQVCMCRAQFLQRSPLVAKTMLLLTAAC